MKTMRCNYIGLHVEDWPYPFNGQVIVTLNWNCSLKGTCTQTVQYIPPYMDDCSEPTNVSHLRHITKKKNELPLLLLGCRMSSDVRCGCQERQFSTKTIHLSNRYVPYDPGIATTPLTIVSMRHPYLRRDVWEVMPISKSRKQTRPSKNRCNGTYAKTPAAGTKKVGPKHLLKMHFCNSQTMAL